MKRVTFWEAQVTTLALCTGSIIGGIIFGNIWDRIIMECFIYAMVVTTCWVLWFVVYQK